MPGLAGADAAPELAALLLCRLLHVRHVGIVHMACEFLGEQKVPICEMVVENSEYSIRGQRKVRLEGSRAEKEKRSLP